MTSLANNLHPPSKKFFFDCSLEDLPRLLRLLLGQQSILDRRNSRAKPRAFRCFFSRKFPNPSGRQSVNNKHLRCRLISVWRQPCKQKYCSSKDFQNLQKHFYFYISQFQKPPCSMSSKQISPVSGSTYVDRSRIRW